MARRRGVTLFKRARAREFRKHPTASEALAWELLRDRRMLGLKFRRQQVIGGYIADFVCVEHRFILELDGGVHLDPGQHERDMNRSRHLRDRGYVVLRIVNPDVDTLSLEHLLANYLNENPPLPRRRRGGRR